ncbi:MAG: hypothetical protein LBQ12_14745 [Deltaproteobacteria bacterium]|nr:hypothetical protein [Deltaproteobacteria bacterium]
MAYQRILVTDLGEHYPASVGGVKPVMSHGLLSGLIESELSADSALFLAEPSVKGREGRIDWMTPHGGPCCDIERLDGPERDWAEDALCLRAGELAALGARLTGADSGERRLAGRLISRLAVEAASAAAGLEGARKVIVVGGVPVMAGWGLALAGAASASARGALDGHELTERESELIRRILAGERPRDFIPRRTPLGDDGAFPAGGIPPVPEAAPEGEAAPEEKPRRGAGGCLGFLLAALAAFLLALFLFLLLAPDAKRAVLGVAAGPASLPDDRRGDALRAELEGLRSRYLDALALCRPGSADPAAEPVPAPVPEPAPEPVQEPVQEPAPEPAPRTPAPDAELTLPADTDDLSFLNGCWKSDAGLISYPEGLPFHYVYCFSDGGARALVALQETNPDGSRARTCTTTGTASAEGGVLTIRDDGPKCDMGQNFLPVTVECRPGESGAADCVYDGGRGPSRTRFTYVGTQ